MIKNNLVSIIMPAYNSQKFICEAIESVINQSHTNWELIIINDGSSDQTSELVKIYLKDERIRFVEQSNSGVSKARNQGLSMMRGDFFCFLDSDDFLPKHSISSRLKKMQNENIYFVDGYVRSFDEELKFINSEFHPKFSGSPIGELLKLNSSCFFGVTWMIRRIPGLIYSFDTDMKHAEDLWFYIQLSSDGGDYTYVNEPVYDRREVKGSAMSDIVGLIKGYLKLYQRIKDRELVDNYDLIMLRNKIRILTLKISLSHREYGLLKYLYKS